MQKNILNWLKNMAHLDKIRLRINFRLNTLQSFLLALIFTLNMGCSGTKRLKSSIQEFQPVELNTFYNQLEVLEMRGKLKLSIGEDGGQTYSANFTVRQKEDKLWFIVKFIGIEFFRGLIDQEKIQVLDRNNKQLLSSTWDEIQSVYHKDLNFETFRNLLLGNPFLVKGANYGFYKTENVYEYDYKSEDSQLLISILFDKRIKHSNWVLENDKIAIEANYDQYDSPTLKNIPYFRQYIVYFHNTQPINIQLEIKNYSFDDQITIPFDIPDRYTNSGLLGK